eukprot:TRINITY_DN12445_c0_g1_i1.p1 TRINITY_DN12445_c0_g1~~TRINITY_DN12445_c0_g1_i1.p1  ORF type:complete len:632 (+),score=209.36 TRINITY_DN12445_c0_g1_i1:93-1988(+)
MAADLDAMLDDAFDQVAGTEDQLEAALKQAVPAPGDPPKVDARGVAGLQKPEGDKGALFRRADLGLAVQLPPGWVGVDEDVQQPDGSGGTVWIARFQNEGWTPDASGAVPMLVITVEDTRSDQVTPEMFVERMKQMAENPPLPEWIARRSRVEVIQAGPRQVGPFTMEFDYRQSWLPGPGGSPPEMRFTALIRVVDGVAYSLQLATPPAAADVLLPFFEEAARTVVIKPQIWQRGGYRVRREGLTVRVAPGDLPISPAPVPSDGVKVVSPASVLVSFEAPTPPDRKNDAPFGICVCTCEDPAAVIQAKAGVTDLGSEAEVRTADGVACSALGYTVPVTGWGGGQPIDCIALWRRDLAAKGPTPVAVAWNRRPKGEDADEDTLREFMTIIRASALDTVVSAVPEGAPGPMEFDLGCGLGARFQGNPSLQPGKWMGRLSELRYGDVRAVYRPYPDDGPATPEMQVIEPYERPESLDAWIAEMLKDLESGGGTLMDRSDGELDGIRAPTVTGRADLPPSDGMPAEGAPKSVVLSVTLVWREQRPLLIRWAVVEAEWPRYKEEIQRVTNSFCFTEPSPAAEAPQLVRHADPASDSPPKKASAVAGLAAQRVLALQRKGSAGKAAPAPAEGQTASP